MNPGAHPFEEYSKVWLFDGKELFITTEATESGIGLDWSLLEHRCKRLSLRIRRVKKEFLRYAAVLDSINVVLIFGIKNPP